MIQGEVPGVQVAGKKITIRGIGTINSYQAIPLVLVDGVEMLLDDNNTLDAINPRLVKSIKYSYWFRCCHLWFKRSKRSIY